MPRYGRPTVFDVIDRQEKARKRKRVPRPLNSGAAVAAATIAARPSPTPRPDTQDVRAQARAGNRARGALSTGGPGRAELEQARAPVKNVRQLQQQLRRAGFKLSVDGVWGPETRRAFEQQQKALAKTAVAGFQRDTAKPIAAKDDAALLGDYGFQGASAVKTARTQNAAARSAALSANVAPVRPEVPGPEHAGGVLGFVTGALAKNLVNANPTSALLNQASRLLDSGDGEQQAGFGGGLVEKATQRALDVWGTSFEEIIRNPSKVFGDTKDIVTGFSQLLGGLAASPYDTSILSAFGKAFVDDYRTRYGDDWQKHAREHPLFGALDAAGALNVAARAVGIAGKVPSLGVRGAVRASFNPSRTGAVRTVATKAGQSAEFNWGRSPLSRAAQRAYDLASSKVPDAAPGSAANRVAKRQARDLKLERSRDVAESYGARTGAISTVQSVIHKPESFVMPGMTQTATRARLFWESQLPKQFQSNEGLSVLRGRLQQELDLIEQRIENTSRRAAGEASLAPATPDDLFYRGTLANAIKELDAAIRVKPSARYRTALDAMDDLSSYVEDVKLRAFADAGEAPNTPGLVGSTPARPAVVSETPGTPSAGRPDTVPLTKEQAQQRMAEGFASRRNRLAQWLGLEGDVGTYVPHNRVAPSPTSGGFNTAAGTLLTPVDTRALHLGDLNTLQRVKTGTVLADPDQLVLNAQRTFSLEMMDRVRRDLWERGADVQMGQPIREGQFVIRERGVDMRDLREKWDVASQHDDEFTNALDEYRQSFIRQVEGQDAHDLEAAGWLRRNPDGTFTPLVEGIRVLDQREVERLFHFLGGKDARKVMGRAGKAGQTVDMLQNFTKLAVLYSNPGYYPANLLGNMVFLGLQQGPVAVRSLMQAGRLHKTNPRLWSRIANEMGEGLASALISETSGTGRTGRFIAGQQRIAQAAGTVDRGPRVAAYFHEARKNGYRTTEAIEALLDSRTPEAIRVKNAIMERARNAMVDFDALSPFEKNIVRRIVFVYPWLRGSAKWAKDFLAEYPERAAVGVTASQAAAQVAEDRWGGKTPDLPSYLEGAFPLSRNGETARVINASSLNPLTTLKEAIQMGSGIAHGNMPVPEYSAVSDVVNPLFKDTWNVVQGENAFGSNVGYLESLRQGLKDVVPGLRLTDELVDAPGLRSNPSKVYADDSAGAILARRAGRVLPYEINRDEAQQSAIREGVSKTTSATRARARAFEERASILEAVKQVAPGNLENGRLPKPLRDAYNRKAAVDAARAIARKGGASGDAYVSKVIPRELDLLASWGTITRGAAAEGKRRTAAGDEKLRGEMRDWIERRMDDAYGALLTDAKRWLREKGATVG